MAMPLPNKPIVSPVLVGRARELATLERALRDAHHGAGRCIVVSGDAGIGKTRLLLEVQRRADAAGFLTLQGYCFEQDLSFPYAPLVDALRTHLAQRPPSALRQTLGPFASEIIKLLPELALVLPDIQPTSPLDPEAEKRRLFESLIQFFVRLSAIQPLLVMLEDLHWSDQVSLDFLHLFARRLTPHPILVLASYRHEDARLPLTRLLAQFDREHLATDIALTRLSRTDVASLLRAILEPSFSVRAEFLDLLHPLTEGNPFLIEEVLKALIAAGGIVRRHGHWEGGLADGLNIPRSVLAAVQRRTEQLSAVAREVLTLAGVAGRRFDFALLQGATGMTDHELLQIIRHLINAQLVVEQSADEFAFRHALTREAVYATLLLRERKALHQKVAATLEQVYATALDQHTASLAYHYHAAEVWDKALHYSRRAGEHAQALYAPHEAIEHFTRALHAAEHLSVPPPLAILRARGKAYETAGHFDSARDDFERVLNAAREQPDGLAEWQALIDLGSLWASRDYSQTDRYLKQALDLARRLDDPATTGHSLNRLGNWYVNVEQPGEGLRYHEEALDLFQALGDRRGLVQTLDLLGMSSQLNSDLVQSTAYYNRVIPLWRELSDRWGLVTSLASLPLCAPQHLHDLDVTVTSLAEGVRAGEEAVEIAAEIGWRAGETYARFNLAMCLGALGDYALALDAAQSARVSAEDIEHRQWITATHTVLGMLHFDLLAFDAARAHLERARILADEIGSRVWTGAATAYLTVTCVAQGELGRAEAILDDTLAANTPMQTQSQRLAWYTRGVVALSRGQAETALRIADELIAAAPHMTTQTVIPRLWLLRGEALAALDHSPEAETVLHAASETALSQGARPLLWRIHAALARLYHAQGRREDALAQSSATHDLLHPLAAGLPAAMRATFIERGLSSLPRLPTPSQAHIEKQNFGGLTAREREVAALVAQGKTNREIADALVVGLRTVEAHITRILNKLDFSSRAQIAAWTVKKGLSPTTLNDD